MRKFSVERTRGTKFEAALIRIFGVTIAGFVLYVIELLEVIMISLLIILPVRYFLIQPFYVKGASMEPTFNDHEYLVIDELSYRMREPVRGEVVVFRYPTDPRQFFIKRIIGLPGETVRIENGQVWIINDERPNGFLLEEPYLPDIRTEYAGVTKVGVDQYFVLGDNRSASLDSRFFGSVYRELIVGRVWIRGWPLDDIRVFSPPEYRES